MTILLLILAIVIFLWMSSLSGRISELEKKLRSQREGTPVMPPYHPLSEVPPPPPAKAVPLSSSVFNVHQPAGTVQAPLKPAKTDAEMETEIATSWLNKIGVVALVLGMVFFFKYAVDQGWIMPWMRIGIGFLVGALLVYLGELWKGKYGNYAHALSGGGVALLYFTVFAAFQFYSLFAYPVAFALLLITAALSVFLSFRYASLTLGILGFFGAFGAPFMLYTETDRQAFLFVYLSLLNIAAVVILLKKYWVELLMLSAIGTMIDFALWAGAHSSSANTYTSLYFLIFTLLLFTVGSASLLRYHHERKSVPGRADMNLGFLQVLVGCFFTVTVYILLARNYHHLLAPLGLLSGIIYYFAYAVADRLEYKNHNYALSFFGSLLLVLAAIWQWDGKPLVLAMLALSLLGSVLGTVLKRAEIRTWGLAILFASLMRGLYEPYSAQDTAFLFNAKFGIMAAQTAGLLLTGWLYSKVEISEDEKYVENWLTIVACVLLWFAVTFDISSVGRGSQSSQNWWTFWWVAYPALIAFIGAYSKRAGLFAVGMILMVLAFFKTLFLPYAPGHPFLLNAKFGLTSMQAIAMFYLAWLYGKVQSKSDAGEILKAAASLLLWYAVSWEIVEAFKGLGSKNARNLSLSLWWAVYAVVLMAVGSVLRSSTFRKVAIALFGLSILKVFLYDVQALDTGYRIVSFIVLGVILLSVSFAYQKNKEKIVEFLEGDTGNKQEV